MIGRALCAALAASAIVAQSAFAADDPPGAETPAWVKVKQSLFDGRPVSNDAQGIIELVVAARAEDAAIVPIAIRTGFAQTSERHIRRLYLIVDNNPSPVAAIFDLTLASGRADLETRIRIEAYTYVRAVAELSDGKLFASSRYVKASGGCSAAAPADAGMSARPGRMRLTVEGEVRYDQPVRAQLMISHPNDSGLVMDQLTRLYTPAYFVRKIDVSYAGKPVLGATVDFTISANPNLRFYFVPDGAGDLKAAVIDTKELRFEASTSVRRGAPPH